MARVRAAAAIISGVGLASDASRSQELATLAASSVAEPIILESPQPDFGAKEQTLAKALRSSTAASSPSTSYYVHVTHWELGTMWDASTQDFTHDISLPMTFQVRPGPGDTVEQTITAGYPLSESGSLPALDDLASSVPGLNPGESKKNTHPADDYQRTSLFSSRPPSTEEGMLEYLTDIQTTNTVAFADDDQGFVQAAGMMLNHWNLGPQSNTALLEVIASNPRIEYTGTATDRAGRTVQTYSVETAQDGLYRTSLLVDSETGRVSGYEETYLQGPRAGDPLFPSGSVLRYIQVHQSEPSNT